MSKQLRQAVSDELLRRHGYRVMETKIKPVHIANALMRAEHETVGKMTVLSKVFVATAPASSAEERLDAVTTMLDTQKERWGALSESKDLKNSTLVTKVLPLLRALLGADGAVFGKSPDLSSFSSPTALTVTGDPSDDGAGLFIFRLWNGRRKEERSRLLDLFHKLTAPNNNPAEMDDLSALFAPLVDAPRTRPRREVEAEDLHGDLSEVERKLRDSADRLYKYEIELDPNPIATVQRIILLAALSVFMHASTRWYERKGGMRRYLVLDASNDPFSTVSHASTKTVAAAMQDAGCYMESVLDDLLRAHSENWVNDPVSCINTLGQEPGSAAIDIQSRLAKRILSFQTEGRDSDEIKALVLDELLREIEGTDRRGLDGYLRLLGIRAGFLYPQQKNPNKRLNPTDRTLEVLVATTIDATERPMEYRDFLVELRERWNVIVGGGAGDSTLLGQSGITLPGRHLRENSERFLDRLVALGLARRLADSVAVVGMMGALHG